MRGLHLFIADIRECKSSEAEFKRINKELANIRAKFGDKKALDGYQKKKYVCKLLFIFLLGHDVEFGHLEAVNLMSSLKYSEKQMGYLFVSVLMSEHSDLVRMILASVKSDLISHSELSVCLALNCVANLGGKEIASGCYTEVVRLFLAGEAPNFVRKKAALALLKFLRSSPEEFPAGEHTSRMVQILSSPDLGVATATTSLMTALAASDPKEYVAAIPIAVNRLHRILFSSDDGDYMYHGVPAPWLTTKLLRLLQVFPHPTEESICGRLNECLSRLVTRASDNGVGGVGRPRPKQQYYNAIYACFFEAVNLLVHYDNNKDLQIKATAILGGFLVHKEVNMRYMAMEGLYSIAQTEFSADAVRRHQPTVLKTLKKDKETTVQLRAADVLYAVCDQNSVTTIVKELLEFLESADFSIREELVLKIAILAEKYVTDYKWYVDVILRLIRLAGDSLAEEVWHRVIQITINRPDVQDYAAKTCYEALLDPISHEAMVSVGAYILGEFGHLIANDPNSTPQKQLDVLQSHYPLMSAPCRAFMLSTYVKFANLFPEMKPQIMHVLRNPNVQRSADTEIQSRANEYLQLILTSPKVLTEVLEEMPPFLEKESGILAKLERGRTVTEQTGTAVVSQRRVAKELQQVTAAQQSESRAAPEAVSTQLAIIANEATFEKFLLHNQGVLYENPVLQIGVKCDFHESIGRMTLFFGNRGNAPMSNVASRPYMPDSAQCLSISSQALEPNIPPEVQLQQTIQFECMAPYTTEPLLDVNITYQGRAVLLTLKLPVTLNKFFQPLPFAMSSEDFFAKWKQLGGPPREVRNIVQAKLDIDMAVVTQQLEQFGLQCLDGIDPKPDNRVCAAILHTAGGQVGVLLRVEPNMDAKMFRFTLRASNDMVAKIVCDQIARHFGTLA
jgi:AP-2 complex subunit alpha